MSYFTYENVGGVAVVTFDAPGEPVNTLSTDMLVDFEKQLTRAAADANAKAIVLVSAKKDNFIAGAKLDWLQTIKTAGEAVSASKQGHAALFRLENFEKPVVAAIHGAALGGGLEVALACDYRIATDSPKTQVGLPETQLGLLPGGGGTQRLPRLIGAQAALDLILTGKSLKAKKALKLGVVDEVVPAPILREVALRRAKELAEGTLKVQRRDGQAGVSAKPKTLADIIKGLTNSEAWAELALEDNPLGRKILFDQARKQLLKKTRGKYPAPERALEVVRAGLEDQKAGYEAEAQGFGEMVVDPVARQLVEIFFATTAMKKENGVKDPKVKPRDVRKIGVLGGGLMGGGIAYVTSALQGTPVRIKDKDDAGAGRALKHVQGLYDERVKRRSINGRERDAKMALVTATTDYSGFKSCDLVIEAVFEDLGLKHRVLKDIEGLGRADQIFASNTSSIPITQIAEGSAHPETVIGMHYFSPVNKMPLLEIITTKKTADWVTATCVEVGKRQGKTVIVVNDGVGFYTSRILAPYMNEAAYLLAEGGDIADIDKALVDFGFPVGPITLLDEVGIDVAEKVGHIMEAAFGDRMKAPPHTETLVKEGRLGRKAKKGFYTYDGKKKEVDATVYASLPHGKDRKRLDRQEIAERCALQMVNEAVLCLGEGILRSPRDGDIGAIFGLGFPPFLGGPFRYVDAQGPGRVLERIEHWQEKLGKRFTPAPLLLEYVKAGKRFYGA